MKQMILLVRFLLFLFIISLLAGCHYDRTEEAVEKAREFALEHTRSLPETVRDYIRFTAPELQYRNMFAHTGMPLTEYAHIGRNMDYKRRRDAGLDYIEANYVWTPPKFGYSVIVLGSGRRNMEYWAPLKLILKDPVPYRNLYESARNKAVSYVTNNMLYLSDSERDRVRFSEAELYETAFDLSFLTEPKIGNDPDDWKKFVGTLGKKEKRRQFSLVWRCDDPEKRIVIAGFGNVAGFKSWNPGSGMVIAKSKLEEYVIAPYDDRKEEKEEKLKQQRKAKANAKAKAKAKPQLQIHTGRGDDR